MEKNIDKDIFNFLRRRYETKEQILGKDDYAITVYILTFNIKGEIYSFNNYMSKKELTYKIVNMLEENETISLGEYNPRIFDENRQKVVQTVRFFLDSFFNLKNKKPIVENKTSISFDDKKNQTIEKIINLAMKQKYDWWKGFELKKLSIAYFNELYKNLYIRGTILVDEDWGATKWREQYMTARFPKNSGWDNIDDDRIVTLSDITSEPEAKIIKEDLIDIVKYISGETKLGYPGNIILTLKFV